MSGLPIAAQGRRLLTPEQVAHYNKSAAQRSRIADALRAAQPRGVIGPELARLANAPSITKRVSELRKKGVRIRTEAVAITGPDGSINTVALYVLDDGPTPQADLFDAAIPDPRGAGE